MIAFWLAPKPRLTSWAITSTYGWAARIASTEPSSEALSSTTTRTLTPRSRSASSDSRQASVSSRLEWLTIATTRSAMALLISSHRLAASHDGRIRPLA